MLWTCILWKGKASFFGNPPKEDNEASAARALTFSCCFFLPLNVCVVTGRWWKQFGTAMGYLSVYNVNRYIDVHFSNAPKTYCGRCHWDPIPMQTQNETILQNLLSKRKNVYADHFLHYSASLGSDLSQRFNLKLGSDVCVSIWLGYYPVPYLKLEFVRRPKQIAMFALRISGGLRDLFYLETLRNSAHCWPIPELTEQTSYTSVSNAAVVKTP